MFTYILEYWNPGICKYVKLGEYNTIERAEIMFNKPYNRRLTRRLIKKSTDIIYTEKGKK